VIVIADAGPLIHLSLIGSLGLLPELYGRILIPDLVYDEVVKSGEGLPGSREVAGAAWIAVESHDPESDLFRLLRGDLDAGEAAAICLAIDRHAEWFLSDDRPARLTAERLGIQVRGSAGILVAAKRKGLVPRVEPLLLRMREEGVWLSQELITKVLQSIGESPQAPAKP
jgi:predicted nucleic acid-binding protein